VPTSDVDPAPGPEGSLEAGSGFDVGRPEGPSSRRVRPLRLAAALEVLLCSGLPTQVLVIGLLAAAGLGPALTLRYVALLTTIDAVLLLGLIALFLRGRGERPGDVMLGTRAVGREFLIGSVLVLGSLLIVGALGAAILRYWPWLHNLEENPLQALLSSPADAVLFSGVAVLAAVREEVQRAFVLRRFHQYLGGYAVGLVVFSLAFGAGHLLQGYDAGVITAALGAFWGMAYVVRGSIVAPLVSHAVFNVLQVIQYAVQ